MTDEKRKLHTRGAVDCFTQHATFLLLCYRKLFLICVEDGQLGLPADCSSLKQEIATDTLQLNYPRQVDANNQPNFNHLLRSSSERRVGSFAKSERAGRPTSSLQAPEVNEAPSTKHTAS